MVAAGAVAGLAGAAVDTAISTEREGEEEGIGREAVRDATANAFRGGSDPAPLPYDTSMTPQQVIPVHNSGDGFDPDCDCSGCFCCCDGGCGGGF
ncbi:uncharacterized protein L201_001163 [Kwoniella dendrophila CBS 6074]|uniref:Secreted protein n=1 Tax=Kwoniella dendrophila CBS 6074 TaxID=1295534 RepID=A0AAX4JLN3_9TREE